MMYLSVVSGPAVEPVIWSDMTDQLRLDSTEEAMLVSSLIVAAREQTELVSRRALITQTLAASLDGWPDGSIIVLPRPPLQSVTSVAYTDANGDSQVMDAGDYTVQTAAQRVVLASGASWPSRLAGSLVTVTYVAGYGSNAQDVPERYKQAIRLLAAHWYEHREALSEIELYDVPLAFESLVMTDRAY